MEYCLLLFYSKRVLIAIQSPEGESVRIPVVELSLATLSKYLVYPGGKCMYNVHTLYVQARTYGFGTDNIRNKSFLDVRVCTYNVRT